MDVWRGQPGFFTVVGYDAEGALMGYGCWRVIHRALDMWPHRSWGPCRHAARQSVEVAMAEGYRRGARVLRIYTWLSLDVARRLSGQPLRQVGEILVHGGADGQ